MFKYSPIPPVPEGMTRKHTKLVSQSGDRYEGEVNEKDDRKDGRGHIIYADGSYFEGYWRDDLPHGRGRRIYKSGDFYEGEWSQGK